MKISILILMFSLETVFGLYCYECSDVTDVNNISGFQPCANGFGKQVGCSGSCAKIEYILNGKSARFCWPIQKDTEGCINNPKGVSLDHFKQEQTSSDVFKQEQTSLDVFKQD